MREFERNDYDQYAGAEPFAGGEAPMIHTLESGLDIIADGSGVSLAGSVGPASIYYRLYESRTRSKPNITLDAMEWVEELEPLTKHEQIALLHNIGFQCVRG